MERLAVISRTGDRIVTFLAAVLVLLMLSYGGYSLYDDWLVGQGGYSTDLMKFKPKPGDLYSLSQLMQLNSDVIGWITVDDTHIDQPVLQSQEDDMEYVNKNPLGEFSLSGSIFLSVLNQSDFSDPYNLTYGHHMESGGMYGDVTEFQDKNFFDTHKTGTVYSKDKVYDLEIFSCLSTNAGDSYVYNPSQYKSGIVESLIPYLKDKSVHFRDLGFSGDDKIIALSTCYDATSNGRVIVFGRMIETEKEEVGSKTWEN